MKKILSLLLAAIMTAAMMSGCGSSAASGSATPASSADSAAASSPAETADGEKTEAASSEGLTIAEIQAAGKLVIGGEMNYEPFEYYDDDENIIGYDIDIWNKIAKDLGVELEIVDVPFSGALTGMDAGQFDAVGCVVGVTAERGQSYNFCSPVWSSTFSVVVMASDSSISTIEDLDGKKVGVQTGSTPELRAKEYSEELKASGGSGFDVVGYNGTTDAFMDMANGGLDACIESYEMCQTMLSTNESFKYLGDLPSVNYLSYAFRAEDTELCDYVSSEIQKFKDDGSLYELQQKWFGYTKEDLPATDFIPAA